MYNILNEYIYTLKHWCLILIYANVHDYNINIGMSKYGLIEFQF